MVESIALVDLACDGFNKGTLFPTLHKVINGPSNNISLGLESPSSSLSVITSGVIAISLCTCVTVFSKVFSFESGKSGVISFCKMRKY